MHVFFRSRLSACQNRCIANQPNLHNLQSLLAMHYLLSIYAKSETQTGQGQGCQANPSEALHVGYQIPPTYIGR